jgi:GT2 family glycosyltransferase
MIHIITPFRGDKDLGKAYNDAINLIPDEDWICVMDIDAMFLTPDAPVMMQKYVDLHPETGVFTCFCNRVGSLAVEQVLGGRVSEESNMLFHIERAQVQRAVFPKVTPILRGEISGYLMLFSKETWKSNKFDEGIGCLAVDTYWSRRIIEQGKDIKRMDGIYIWHTYRLWKSITDKSHLK